MYLSIINLPIYRSLVFSSPLCSFSSFLHRHLHSHFLSFFLLSLFSAYVRKAAYEMLNISDMCEGHGWRVLEELRRLLVLRQGRVSLPWDREEESCRVCLAHLALLKRTFEKTVVDEIRKDCLMAVPPASSHFQHGESSLLPPGYLLSPSSPARSQTLAGELPIAEQGGGLRREDSPSKKKVSFSFQAALRSPSSSDKRGQSDLRRQTDVRHQWLRDLRKSLELSTAYATKGRKQPAVFLRVRKANEGRSRKERKKEGTVFVWFSFSFFLSSIRRAFFLIEESLVE